MAGDRQDVESHGQSAVAVALCPFRGVQLLPRLQASHNQRLYRPAAGPPEASPTLQPLRRRPITGPRLAPAYANMSTYSTAVRLGTAAPEAMRRRFTRHHMPPPTSTARWERGTARRTSVLCRSLRLRDLRRELHEGRNGVAQWPSANACILFGTGGEIATQRREEQA